MILFLVYAARAWVVACPESTMGMPSDSKCSCTILWTLAQEPMDHPSGVLGRRCGCNKGVLGQTIENIQNWRRAHATQWVHIDVWWVHLVFVRVCVLWLAKWHAQATTVRAGVRLCVRAMSRPAVRVSGWRECAMSGCVCGRVGFTVCFNNQGVLAVCYGARPTFPAGPPLI